MVKFATLRFTGAKQIKHVFALFKALLEIVDSFDNSVFEGKIQSVNLVHCKSLFELEQSSLKAVKNK
jgi:hypothetical protein